jgi:hypothetical protein
MRRYRRQVALALAALVALAFALRALPLHWSPLPSTLDGFKYAALARTTVQSGSLPLTGRADSLFFTSLLATAGIVLDVPPLRLAQPLATTIGTGVCLFGVVIARRVVRESPHVAVDPATVSLAAAGLLAVEGLFLRRTSVPDEEIVGILFTLVVAFALHYAYRSGRARWYLIAGLPLGVFPFLHTFSSLVVGLVVVGLTARHISQSLTRRSVVGGVALVGGFWLYIVTYYRLAEAQLSLVVPYVDRVTAYPGLFVAWVIILVVGVVWVQRTSLRVRQASYVSVVGSFFAIVALNAFTPVFPGTVGTPQVVLALVAPLGVVALAASLSLDAIGTYRGGAILVALFAAPAAVVGFSLTASLTPEYFGTAMRGQTFLHPAVLVVSAITIARLAERNRRRTVQALRVTVAVVVVLATVATAPLAVVNMDTGTVPSTTLDSEYEGVKFVSTNQDRAWATDHSLSRVGLHYFDANVTFDPVASWLTGGPSPTCTVVSQTSWTTTGAHLFPSGPRTVSAESYGVWLDTRNVIYSASGRDPVVVSTPRRNADGC